MRKIYPEIHILRILACLMVLLIHTTATPVVSLTPNSLPQLIFIWINRLSKPSVPMFIFISGFLLHAGKSQGLQLYYRKKLPKLVVPYILWATLYYGVFWYFGYYPLNAVFYVKGLLQGSFIYHLYFMIIIIQLYVLYPLLEFLEKRVGTLGLFIATVLFQIGSTFLSLPLQDRLFCTYISYFTLGLLAHSLYSHPWLDSTRLKISALVAFLVSGGYYTLQFIKIQNEGFTILHHMDSVVYMTFSLISCGALWILLKSVPQIYDQHKKTAKFLSDATLNVYYAHPLIIMLSNYTLDRLGIISISFRAFFAFVAILIILLPLLWCFEQITSKYKRLS